LSEHAKRLITQRQYPQALADLERNWPTVQTLEMGDALALLVGAIADQHLIRDCDAVHMAVTFQAMTNEIEFLTFDQQLEKRLAASGLLTLWTI
jgi:hypothetical protein